MRTRLPGVLMSLVIVVSAPAVVLAAVCGDPPLTEDQQDYLDGQGLEIKVPEGGVPVIIRCDVDGNNVINNDDLKIIKEHRGQPAAHPDDPMDWDGNGVIHGRDVGGCASSCSLKGCAVKKSKTRKILQAAAETASSTPAEIVGMGLVGDANLYANDGGVTTVYYGPAHETAHSDEERVSIAQLTHCARVYALAAVTFCKPATA